MRTDPLYNGQARRPRRPNIGVIPGAAVERAFIGLMYTGVVLLVVLSVFGTFYGLQGRAAPLSAPWWLWRMVLDAWEAPAVLGRAFLVQAVLTIAQWGAHELAGRDRLWWLAWLAALAPSVYYNVQAYFDPAIALGAPWLIALILIAAGDIVPELVGIKRD
jgi:hypothetical protein